MTNPGETVYNRTQDNDIVIASGAAASTTLKLFGRTVLGVWIPAAMTNSSIGINLSKDGLTYVPLYKSGANVTYTCPTSTAVYIPLSPSDFAGIEYIQITTPGGNEGAARLLSIATGNVLNAG